MAQKEGKKGSKIGRGKRKPSNQRRLMREVNFKSKHPRVKGSNPTRVEPGGFCLDTLDARMPEKFMPPQFTPLHPRDHIGNELAELAAHAPDSPRLYRNDALDVTRQLTPRARRVATAAPTNN